MDYDAIPEYLKHQIEAKKTTTNCCIIFIVVAVLLAVLFSIGIYDILLR